MKRTRVVILGGGFAGLACANRFDSSEFSVTLIDRKSFFEFIPNIHELVSGVKKRAELRLNLRRAMASIGHRFLRGDIESIDPENREVVVNGKTVKTDYLVIAIGSADATYGVSGVGKYALPFRCVDDCHAIYTELERRRKQRVRTRVVVVGGGLAGVEALGEVLRRHRAWLESSAIIEAQERLLPALPESVANTVTNHCDNYGVSLITNDPVARVTAKSVLLGSGQRLRSDLTIWTGGPTPPSLLSAAGLAAKGEWAATQSTLEHSEFEKVYVIGDSARPPSTPSKQAYHALDMGDCAGDNIIRATKRKRPRRYRPVAKPTLMSFGDIDTVLISGKRAFAGPALAAGKEAVFTGVMTQLDQRPIGERLESLLSRGEAAGRELLWPAISRVSNLRRQIKVKRL